MSAGIIEYRSLFLWQMKRLDRDDPRYRFTGWIGITESFIKLIVKKREETKKKRKEGQVHLIVRFFDRFTRKKNGESGPETNQQPVPFSIWFVWSMIGFNQSLFEVVSRWMIEIWVGWEIILPIRRMKWLKLWSLMHCNVFCMDKANSTRSDKCFQSSAESASSCSRVH